MSDKTTIVVEKTTRDRIARLGRYNDTMDNIIQRMLDGFERAKPEGMKVKVQ